MFRMKTLPLVICIAIALFAGVVVAETSPLPTDSRISEAAMQGDVAGVRALLQQKADVNGAQADGSTALHWAAYNDNAEMAEMLVKAGANVNATTRLGNLTPLLMAATNGSTRIVELLLKAGADANSANDVGTTALMFAAGAGDAAMVRLLLDHGANVNAKDATNGQTALMFAAARDREEAIRVLIKAGADTGAVSRSFSLQDLYKNDKPEPSPITELQRLDAIDRAAKGIGGNTALHFAAREGNRRAVRALVEGGADVNIVSASDKTPAITQAIFNGQLEIAKYLLDHGANPNLINSDGVGPLFATIAIQWANISAYPRPSLEQESVTYLQLMEALLAKGDDPNVRITRELWFQGRLDDDWVDSIGATPFWRAAQANDVDAMRLLVRGGANPNIPTTRGCSPLQVAAGYGFELNGAAAGVSVAKPNSRLDAVKYLVEEVGADVNSKDENGYTALHGAAFVGSNDIIKYLVSKGADVKARSTAHVNGNVGPRTFPAPEGKGDTVADMANGMKQSAVVFPETIALLESLGSENSDNCRSNTCVLKANAPGFAKRSNEKK